jgi:hypothetical protein
MIRTSGYGFSPLPQSPVVVTSSYFRILNSYVAQFAALVFEWYAGALSVARFDHGDSAGFKSIAYSARATLFKCVDGDEIPLISLEIEVGVDGRPCPIATSRAFSGSRPLALRRAARSDRD